jgi:peptide/nickel transport system ATP-binding protein
MTTTALENDPGADTELMRNLHRTAGTSIILITHDLGVVAEMCQRVATMYGQIVDETTLRHCSEIQHLYHRLIGSIPILGQPRKNST